MEKGGFCGGIWGWHGYLGGIIGWIYHQEIVWDGGVSGAAMHDYRYMIA